MLAPVIAAVMALAPLQAPPAAGSLIVGAEVRFSTLGNINVFYPEQAFRQGRSGQTTLLCYLGDAEQLKACSILTETPKEWDFGAAMLHAASSIRIDPAEAMKADDVVVMAAIFTSKGNYGDFKIAVDLKRAQPESGAGGAASH